MPILRKVFSVTLRSSALACIVLVEMFIDSAQARSAPASRSPNIIFILADDLGYGDLGCFGQRLIQTPNLDRLAARGMRLTQHYSGNAVCAPSRCVLMTGKHPGNAIVRDNRGLPVADVRGGVPEREGQFPIPDETLTIAERLRPFGYRSGGFGKWGLGGPDSSGAPLRQGFDRWFGYNCQAVAHNFYPTYL
jgi:arylsulfatase A